MKGKIVLKINQDTMVEAVQMYLDSQMTAKHTVTAVKSISADGYGGADEFEIGIAENRAPKRRGH